jgi:NAD(P)H-hydrate repair Nnr-like enzyme with NAD(P)H-hydrate dehydratase domain
MSSFKGTSKKTWRGKCLVILRPTGKEGKIVLKAKAAGLGEGEVVVETDGR